ncbi:hypothetical protein BC834DRAFT_852507 [Gloeopeniophorella convolvens]|nr:hypothetical protein BC834DRAFT_852507 [Gloeopeniophorella convolvens]
MTPNQTNSTSMSAARGAEMLAAMSAPGVYHPFESGPSAPLEPWDALVYEQLAGSEGREETVTMLHAGGEVQQQIALSSAEPTPDTTLWKDLNKLNDHQKALLEMSPAEQAVRAVQNYRCRTCPGTVFDSLAGFQRHCSKTDQHPESFETCTCGYWSSRPLGDTGDALEKLLNAHSRFKEWLLEQPRWVPLPNFVPFKRQVKDIAVKGGGKKNRSH